VASVTYQYVHQAWCGTRTEGYDYLYVYLCAWRSDTLLCKPYGLGMMLHCATWDGKMHCLDLGISSNSGKVWPPLGLSDLADIFQQAGIKPYSPGVSCQLYASPSCLALPLATDCLCICREEAVVEVAGHLAAARFWALLEEAGGRRSRSERNAAD
jgi:hypothetical protein